MAYCGDAGFNMGNSLMVGCAKMGLDFVACAPKKYFPRQELTDTCKALAKLSGGSVTQTEDILAGVKDADVIYTDVWVSMGEPMEVWEERIHDLAPYQVNAAVMAAAKPGAIFMHCLPSFHDTETFPHRRRWARGSAGIAWRSATTCSPARSRWSLTRRKTACTRLKP